MHRAPTPERRRPAARVVVSHGSRRRRRCRRRIGRHHHAQAKPVAGVDLDDREAVSHLLAIAYDDRQTAEDARLTLRRLHLGDQLEPGRTALLVLIRQSTPDEILSQIEQYGGHVLQTSLTGEAEERLRKAVGEQPSGAA